MIWTMFTESFFLKFLKPVLFVAVATIFPGPPAIRRRDHGHPAGAEVTQAGIGELGATRQSTAMSQEGSFLAMFYKMSGTMLTESLFLKIQKPVLFVAVATIFPGPHPSAGETTDTPPEQKSHKPESVSLGQPGKAQHSSESRGTSFFVIFFYRMRGMMFTERLFLKFLKPGLFVAVATSASRIVRCCLRGRAP